MQTLVIRDEHINFTTEDSERMPLQIERIEVGEHDKTFCPRGAASLS